MQDRNRFNWKTAAAPLAALAVALAVGVGYFAGGSSQDAATAPGQDAQFKFDSGPRYAPGTGPAARTQQAGSSIDMFRKANENYSAETAPAGEPASKKPRTKKELQEFMRQMSHDINMDPAALAAADAAAGQAGGGTGATGRGPAARSGAGGEQPAAGAAVYSRQGAGAASRSGSLASKRSSFSAGRLAGSSLSGGSGGLRQARGAGSSFGSDTAGGASQDTDGAFVSGGGGRSLEAGAYGSHGGGGASSPQMAGGASQSESGKMSAGGPQQQEKKVPEAVGFLWPRTFDFGDMYMYETAARQVILMNIGDAALKVGKIANMDDETPFYAEKDKCSNTTLAPGKSCTFLVRFSPKAVRDYVTGFEIPSNDENAMTYQGYIEVKGNSKYSYSTWWWRHHWSGPAGYNNRLTFGLVPEGYTMDQVLRITNNSGSEWEDIKLDKSRLPASFRLSGDGCTGGSLGPHQSCAVPVSFAPTAADNRRFSTALYGQYHSVDYASGAKSVHPRPGFPPLVLEKPVEAAPAGKLVVKANFNILHTGQVVQEIPVSAVSSGPFPVKGLGRVQHYYFFR